MPPRDIEPGTEWGLRGKCFFCPGPEGGYAKKDDKGRWHPACWDCVRLENPPPPPKPKKKPVYKPAEEEDASSTNSDIQSSGAQVAPVDAPATERREVVPDGELGHSVRSGELPRKRINVRRKR